MATTQIADVIVPEYFHAYTSELATQMNKFFLSGVVTPNAVLNERLAAGGKVFDFPQWDSLGTPASNVSSDAPGSSATPNKHTAKEQIAVRLDRNNAWQSADLAGMLAGSDPLNDVAGKVAGYWTLVYSSLLSQTITGVIADNIANDSSDMINDVGTDATGTPAATELFSAEAYIDAAATLGEHQDEISALAVHPTVYSRMKKLDLIDFIPDSESKKEIATYQGARVILDSLLPTITGTNRTKYYSILFTPGSFGWGETAPKVPVAVDRDELAGDGGGVETLSTRKAVCLHPNGFKFTSSSVAGASPTNAELATAANWDRVSLRENVGWAVLSTNG